MTLIDPELLASLETGGRAKKEAMATTLVAFDDAIAALQDPEEPAPADPGTVTRLPLTTTTALTAIHREDAIAGGRQWLVPLATDPTEDMALTISGDDVSAGMPFAFDVPDDPGQTHGLRTVELGPTTLGFVATFVDDSAVIQITGGPQASAVIEVGDVFTLPDVADWTSSDLTVTAVDFEVAPPEVTIAAAMEYTGEAEGPEEAGTSLPLTLVKAVGSLNGGTDPVIMVPGAQVFVLVSTNPSTGPVVKINGGIVAPVTVHDDIVGSAEFDTDSTPPAVVGMNVTLPVLPLTTGAKTAIPAYAGRKLLADDAITINAGVFPAGTVMAVWYDATADQPSFAEGTQVILEFPDDKIAAPKVRKTAISAHYATTVEIESVIHEVWHVEGNLDDA